MPSPHVYFAVCDCGLWGEVLPTFNETRHVNICNCGKTMFLLHGQSNNPREVGYHESKKITPRYRVFTTEEKRGTGL
jgi:hypothetical protein